MKNVINDPALKTMTSVRDQVNVNLKVAISIAPVFAEQNIGWKSPSLVALFYFTCTAIGLTLPIIMYLSKRARAL